MDKVSRRSLLQSELAVSRMMTYVTSIPDPDEMLSKAGIKRYQLRQLELDDEISQCIDTRREAVISTNWRVEPYNRIGKWVENALKDHIEDVMRGCMDARFYGYSVMEMMYKKDTVGRIAFDRIVLKPMEWFSPTTKGELLYFPDDGSGGTDGVKCDPLKFLLTRVNSSYRNPYGEALLSRLWFPVTWRREGWGMWLQFLETFGEPIVFGLVQDYQGFVEAMTQQGVRSTVAFQSVAGEDHIETISASTPGEFDRLEQAIVRRIQKLILGQTLTSDVGANGSYAVAAIHNEVRNDKRRADIRMVKRAGQHLVNCLAYMNNFEAPEFVMSDDSGLEMHRAQRDAILVSVLQSSGLKFTKGYLIDNYDIDEDDLDESDEMNDTVDTVDNIDDNKDDIDEQSIVAGESNILNQKNTDAVKNQSVADE